MTVEVFCHGQSMGIIRFQHWETFETYMMRWLTHSVQINIMFDSLQEQQAWYSDIMDMINCVHKTAISNVRNHWQVYYCGLEKVVLS